MTSYSPVISVQWLVHWNTWHHLSPNVITSENSKNTNNSLWNPIQFLPKTVHTPLPAKCIYLSSLSHFDNPPSSQSHLHPGPRDSGGGTVLQTGCCLSLCCPPPSSPHLGHRPEWPVHQSLLWQWGSLLLLLPAPPEEHEWQEAGLSGVASDFFKPPQDPIQPGGALWVFSRIIQRQDNVTKKSSFELVPLLFPHLDILIHEWRKWDLTVYY